MKRILIISFILLLSVYAVAQQLVKVGDGYSCTSVNTTIFRNNSIVTHNNHQYISYYDAQGWLIIGKRKVGSQKWVIARSQY